MPHDTEIQIPPLVILVQGREKVLVNRLDRIAKELLIMFVLLRRLNFGFLPFLITNISVRPARIVPDFPLTTRRHFASINMNHAICVESQVRPGFKVFPFPVLL